MENVACVFPKATATSYRIESRTKVSQLSITKSPTLYQLSYAAAKILRR